MSCLVSTIIYQLIQVTPEIRDCVLMLLGNHPHILSQAPSSQMKILVVDPLNMVLPTTLSQRPKFIIIDGLDECGDPESQCEVNKLLASATTRFNTPLLFLIASRPELDIRLTFHSNVLVPITHLIPLQHSCEASEDIRLVLQANFKRYDRDIPCPLVNLSTLLRYVQSSRHRPEHRLATILALRSDEDEAFAGLDSLYLQIMTSVDKERLEKVLDISSLYSIHSPQVLCSCHCEKSTQKESFLCYQAGDLDILLNDLHSVIFLPPPESPSDPMEIYHASFFDFLLDRALTGGLSGFRTRSCQPRMSLDPVHGTEM
ncbi:hypothetical protein M413DRAFT_31174 [Hebeloma cylindrosporum]|uniref:Nephrocystin 3-like N-terminal domain-containing protein n=1 Tax=Hebeloma cylindrosporum TaxID=76867 RepID=A0A0C3BJT8_HEBCY|nr:hypothetical protein M413DRAFT_31174 [Hebeloma cylindrosporum h7]